MSETFQSVQTSAGVRGWIHVRPPHQSLTAPYTESDPHHCTEAAGRITRRFGPQMMVTMAGWWWIAVLLVMSVSGSVPVDSLTDPQTEAVRLVREDFHKSNKVKNAFQVSSMLAATQEEHFDGEGKFVKVRFIMKQTNCERRKWMNQNCVPIVTAKRTYNCVGCFTFTDRGDLQTGYRKCVRQSHANTKEVRKERRKECAKLKKKKRTYDVGAYSFRSAPLGNYD